MRFGGFGRRFKAVDGFAAESAGALGRGGWQWHRSGLSGKLNGSRKMKKPPGNPGGCSDVLRTMLQLHEFIMHDP